MINRVVGSSGFDSATGFLRCCLVLGTEIRFELRCARIIRGPDRNRKDGQGGQRSACQENAPPNNTKRQIGFRSVSCVFVNRLTKLKEITKTNSPCFFLISKTCVIWGQSL